MYLTENLNILAKHFPVVYKKLKGIEGRESSEAIRLETARSGMPTVLCETESGTAYIHSKYDPVAEAERFIGQYKDIDRYKHVFFYGLGLGYHVEEFCRKWPDKRYMLYEPEPSILLGLLNKRELKKLPLNNCEGIHFGSHKEDIEPVLLQYVNKINGEVLLIVLPSYERVFGSSIKSFREIFSDVVMLTRATLKVNTNFQKLWTTNSIRNFREVLSSSNILQDKERFFAGKPAIIAAAGPSLEDELENLRYIKEKGLAYIFSVGSAVKTLIANGIVPHAVCIYDPGPNTAEVVKIVKEQELDIPLVFGSSVYYGALEDYPGPKFHMLTSQDTVSPYLLKDKGGRELQTILDSPSIAIITLQLLSQLGCAPIILVGQNFAFKNNRYYAKGIDYKARPGELRNVDLDNALKTVDVHGGVVYTNSVFVQMRKNMEECIKRFNIHDVINCTDGGARIEGTTYRPLKELMGGLLSKPAVADDWVKDRGNSYDLSYMVTQNNILLTEYKSLYKLLNNISLIMDRLEEVSGKGSDKAVYNALSSFDKEINKVLRNRFFNVILRPMNRRQLDIINRNLNDIYSVIDLKARAKKVIENFKAFIEECTGDLADVTQLFYEINDFINEHDIKILYFTIKAAQGGR
jgi:hypothetical protein